MATSFALNASRLLLLEKLLQEESLVTAPGAPIPKLPADAPAPLSFAQRRLWFLYQLDKDSLAYSLPVTLRLKGTLEVTVLRDALACLVERHAALRTRFEELKGPPRQRVLPPSPIALPLEDLRAYPRAERHAVAGQRVLDEVRRPFDLVEGPLIRARLLRVAETEHLLMLNQHHIVSDGWSTGLMIRELAHIYGALIGGVAPQLPDLPIRYGDYAAWERARMQGERLERALAYWREQLAGASPQFDLPTDRPRPPVSSGRGGRVVRTLSPALTSALRSLSRERGVTLFMTMLAVFDVLLYRLSGQGTLLVGSPITLRTRSELEGVVGFFVNTLVLRADLDGQSTFDEVLDRVRDTVLGANAHRNVPLDMLVSVLHPDRTLGAPPLFQVMFDLQPELPPVSAGGVTFRPVDPPEGVAKFDLTLDVIEREAELVTALEYDADLFEAETAQRWLARYETLLAAITRDADCPVGALPTLPTEEQQLVLETWNATEIRCDGDVRMHERVAAHAARRPKALAVGGQGQMLTYGELNAEANQLAHHLRALGVGPEVPVGICLERSPRLLVAVLGVLKAGGAYVPLDPDYPADRLAYMLEDAGAPVLLTQASSVDALPEHGARMVVLDAEETLAAKPATDPAVTVAPENLAYIIYTSGATGRPKGTLVPHRALENAYAAWRRAYDLPSLRAHLQMASFSFDVFTGDWARALGSGAKLVLCPRDALLEPARLHALMTREGVDAAEFVPAVIRVLADHLESTGGTLDAIKLLAVGSDVWHEGEYLRFRRLCGPETRLINSYGVTEATIDSTYFEMADGPAGDAALPIGRPFANVRLYILDARMRPVPVGVPGELYIGGAGVARGYHRRPSLTAARFVPDPWGPPGARLYRTGDLVRYRHDGQVMFLGRADDQIKLRGYRIEVGEIEAVLVQHPQAEEGVVAVQERGGHKTLVAYVTPADALDATALRQWLSKRLPDYMVPGRFAFLDALPLTPNGKVDRRALPEVKALESVEIAAPRDAREATLARVWGEVLGLEQVGIHDNFFNLGGDSILSLQVIARARREGLHFTPRQLFQHQTVAELATVIETAAAVAAEQGPVIGEVQLTPIQRWFFEADFAEPHHWNQAVLLEVLEPLAQPQLEAALEAVLAHHDALRMRYTRDEAGWRQVIVPSGDVPCERVDLAHLADVALPEALASRTARAQAALDLEVGPLLRAIYFDLGAERADRLLLVAHHLVVDTVSLRLIIEDVQRAILQQREGSAIALPSKTTSFKRWAEKLVAYAREASVLREELPHWVAMARQAAPALPLDFPAGPEANREAEMAWLAVALDAESTRALLHEAPAAYATQIDDLLLAALVLALAPWIGERALLADVEGHGREDLFDDVDLSRTVGWFTAVYPVWLDLRDTEGPGAAIKAIKEQRRAIPQHGIGYGLLRYLAPKEAAIAPLRSIRPQLAFNYLGQFGSGRDAEAGLFREAPEDFGPLHSPRATRPYVLEIEVYVSDGCLNTRWTYGQALHRRETIEGLAEAYLAALRELIAHCLAPEAGGYTPSDFPEAELSQDALDDLLAEFEELS
jgi:amino acid adenylation domain-containing protein/non-ribosomal peptide synthase protein (TIGR01720 family)